MKKVIHNRNTKWKSTDNTIRQILIDKYQKTQAFKLFYHGITTVMEFAMQEDEKNKKSSKKIKFSDLKKEMKHITAANLITQSLMSLSTMDFMVIGERMENVYKAVDIEKKYKISNVTLKKRLIGIFFDKVEIKERNLKLLGLKPKMNVLWILAFYQYLKDQDVKQDSLFRKIVNLFEGNE